MLLDIYFHHEESSKPQYKGSGARRRHADPTVDEVESQWELLALRIGESPRKIPDIAPIPAASVQDAIEPVAAASAIPDSGVHYVHHAPAHQDCRSRAAQDTAMAADEAKRQRNNRALAILLLAL